MIWYAAQATVEVVGDSKEKRPEPTALRIAPTMAKGR
jgi:hypothetical protein